MRTKRLLLPLVLLVAAPLLVGACGGSDDDGGDDEAQITEVIETSIASTDPDDCTKLETQNFMEQVNFATGEDAVADCEESAGDTSDDPDSVEVANVEVDGDAATADATFTGSAFDGSTLSVALVKEDDQWKLDEITDIPTLNLEGFQTAFSEGLAADGEVPPEIASCISDAIGQATEDEVKTVILEGSEEGLVGLFGDCLPAS
jgi:hypothetical protein